MDDYEELLVEQEEEQLAEALAEEHQAELTVTVSAGNVITKSVEAAWIFRLITVLRSTAKLSLMMSMMC